MSKQGKVTHVAV